jgi:uncharacterized protein
VNKQLPTREQAIEILRKYNCSARVIEHCQAVAKLALQLARQLEAKNHQINLQLVEAGALLHDLGRSKTHKVDHSIIGAKIAQEEGLPEQVISIIKRHVGAGITAEEAQWLGWPKDNYIPQTLEEKIVCYADKCIDSNKQIPVQATIQQLHDENMEDAAERVRKLHNEITSLLEA